MTLASLIGMIEADRQLHWMIAGAGQIDTHLLSSLYTAIHCSPISSHGGMLERYYEVHTNDFKPVSSFHQLVPNINTVSKDNPNMNALVR